MDFSMSTIRPPSMMSISHRGIIQYFLYARAYRPSCTSRLIIEARLLAEMR